MTKLKLSIVVLSYNTKDLLKNCLDSLEKIKKEMGFEVVVVDNASKDGSVEMVKKQFLNHKIIINKKNLGFAAGNNKARKYCRGKYVLFLNSDTLVHKGTLEESVNYLDKHKNIGAMSCKILLPDGKLDRDSRRSFINPWVGLTHIFLKLDRIFPKSKLFAKYWYGYISEDKIHEVDALQGAYFLTRKKILDDIGWFDEDYFLDGEDIDLCWRIKEKGWKIVYFPKVSITHFKGSSKGKVESETKRDIPLRKRLKYRMAGVDSMEIFVRKRLWKRYPLLKMLFVLSGIKALKALRFTRTVVFG
jgi:GT2 family glycosyltransferase